MKKLNTWPRDKLVMTAAFLVKNAGSIVNIYSAPKSNLVNISEHMCRANLFWKLFFWVNCLWAPLAVIGLFVLDSISIFDRIDMITSPVIFTALYGFVYGKRIGIMNIWKCLGVLYPLWLIFYEGVMPFWLNIPQYGVQDKFVFSLRLVMILEIPSAIAIYLYGYKSNQIWSQSQG